MLYKYLARNYISRKGPSDAVSQTKEACFNRFARIRFPK